MRKLAFTLVFSLIAGIASAEPPPNDWYWDLPVTLHFDNHGELLGKGQTVEALTAKLRGLPIGLLQVSARSSFCTYPTRIGVAKPGAETWDTPGVWRQVANRLGVRFGIYVNVIDDAVTKNNPQWLRRTSAGNAADRMCLLPSLDGRGYLERIQIPIVQELIARYHPDMLWFDGDWNTPLVDYCENCKQAWKNATGEDRPPADPRDPRWASWVALEDLRVDDYKAALAAAIHKADPKCLYVSNWSWAISQRDPRQAPDWAGALSGDAGAGNSQGSLSDVRFSQLMLSAQEDTPHDQMSAIYPKPVRSLARMLQEGALTMAGGSNWFLWISAATDDQIANARVCSNLVMDRRDVLTRTHSDNPVAVLLSETTWKAMRAKGGFDWKASRDLAFALQDKGYGVDIVNEAILAKRKTQYQAVFAVNQPVLGDPVRGIPMLTSISQLRLLPTVTVESAPGNPQLVFSRRTKGSATILHLTDLTSFANGKRIDPDSRADIDPNEVIQKLRISYALPARPRTVRVVPSSTSVSYEWRDGRLHVTLQNVKIHAAVISAP